MIRHVCDVSSRSTLFASACLTKYIQYSVTYGKSHAQTGKIMTKPLVITNRLSITMAGLIVDYLFSTDKPALSISMVQKDITKTRLFKYMENFTSTNWKISNKKNWYIFHISAQNIDCGYSLEPPLRGGSNEYHNLCFLAKIRKVMYTPVNPSFTI